MKNLVGTVKAPVPAREETHELMLILWGGIFLISRLHFDIFK